MITEHSYKEIVMYTSGKLAKYQKIITEILPCFSNTRAIISTKRKSDGHNIMITFYNVDSMLFSLLKNLDFGENEITKIVLRRHDVFIEPEYAELKFKSFGKWFNNILNFEFKMRRNGLICGKKLSKDTNLCLEINYGNYEVNESSFYDEEFVINSTDDNLMDMFEIKSIRDMKSPKSFFDFLKFTYFPLELGCSASMRKLLREIDSQHELNCALSSIAA